MEKLAVIKEYDSVLNGIGLSIKDIGGGGDAGISPFEKMPATEIMKQIEKYSNTTPSSACKVREWLILIY